MREIIFSLPDRLKTVVQEELQANEKVMWAQKPLPKHFARRNRGAFWFGIPWTAFALLWMIGASSASNIFALFGLPFVIIGFGMLLSPLWSRINARKSLYVITDKRAIIFEKGRGIKVRSFLPRQLQEISREQFKDGTGNIILKHDHYLDSDRNQKRNEVGFIGVENVKKIESLVRNLAEKASSPGLGDYRRLSREKS